MSFNSVRSKLYTKKKGKIISFKKKLSAILMAAMMCLTILGGISSVSASEKEVNPEELFSQEQYDKGVSEGWIGEDMSLEDLQQLQKESLQLAEQLENDPNFYEVKTTNRSKREVRTNNFRAGDIIITNGVKLPILGHAGIFVGKNTILHIAGPKHKVSTITPSRWLSSYTKEKNTWSKVFRCKKSSYGPAASDWAMKHYFRSNATYEINKNRKSTSKTYCSKMVWQAYYFGVGSKSVNDGLNSGYILPLKLQNHIRNCEKRATYYPR